MTLYSFIHCPYAACIGANDLIRIRTKENDETDYNNIIFQTGSEDIVRRDYKWNYDQVIFDTRTTSINVSFLIRRSS